MDLSGKTKLMRVVNREVPVEWLEGLDEGDPQPCDAADINEALNKAVEDRVGKDGRLARCPFAEELGRGAPWCVCSDAERYQCKRDI